MAEKRSVIEYEFSRELSVAWAALDNLYKKIGKAELIIWGMIKYAKHSLGEKEYTVLQMRFAPVNRHKPRTCSSDRSKSS
jgi:hypothetical protein